jgi:uncharacterized protein YegP (UPF0339 family)
MKDELYDWVDDDSMDAEETMRRFSALNPVPTTGPVGVKQSRAKFEVYKDKSGKFRFRLKAGNGEIIAVGEAYESKAAALAGIKSVQASVADAEVLDRTG